MLNWLNLSLNWKIVFDFFLRVTHFGSLHERLASHNKFNQPNWSIEKCCATQLLRLKSVKLNQIDSFTPLVLIAANINANRPSRLEHPSATKHLLAVTPIEFQQQRRTSFPIRSTAKLKLFRQGKPSKACIKRPTICPTIKSLNWCILIMVKISQLRNFQFTLASQFLLPRDLLETF